MTALTVSAAPGAVPGPVLSSIRMPPSLTQPSSRQASKSFGHLRAMPDAPHWVRARAAAMPTARLRPDNAAALLRNFHSTENVRLAPGGAIQARPRRPRPAVWCSAASTVPEGKVAQSRSRSELVDAVESTTRTSNQRRASGGNSAAMDSMCKASTMVSAGAGGMRRFYATSLTHSSGESTRAHQPGHINPAKSIPDWFATLAPQ